MTFRMIMGNGLGDRLQDHGFTGLGRGHDESALAFADRCNQIDDSGSQIFGTAVADFEFQLFIGEQWRQVYEQDLVLGLFWRFKIYLGNLEQGKKAFTILGWANLAGNIVTGPEIKTPDLTG